MRRRLPLLLILVSQSGLAALSGSLETRFQYDDYFEPGAWMEQWVNLDYRRRGGPSAGLLANLGAGDRAWAEVHRLYLRTPLYDRGPELTAGRTERIDAAGLYTLDGLGLTWGGAERNWELYGGAPVRTDYYAIPDRDDDGLDQPAGRRLLGLRMNRTLAIDGLETSSFGFGLRRYWAGTHAWRLDGRFAGAWRLAPERPLHLDGALSLNPDDGRLDRFDLQLRIPAAERGQVLLRARRYEPPEDPITFRDRYYRYYARGPQTVAEAGYRGRLQRRLEWGANLRVVARETGADGIGGDLSARWRTARGDDLELRGEWLQADDEHAGGLFGTFRRALDSRLLLTLSGALRDEHSRLYGDKQVLAGELQLQWMWSRNLHLQALLELARTAGDTDDQDQYRFGLRLVYRLPARYAEDYR